MLKIIFACHENQNQYEEEVEFEDNATEDEITEAYKDWVWEEIGDRFSWREK